MADEENQNQMSIKTDIPIAAQITNDLDAVILTSHGTYRGQLVCLAAAEKGIKFKKFDADHSRKLVTLEPWYVKLNPKAYVPTLLVHPNNKPVCESNVIIDYIENNFEGTKSLSPGDDEIFKERCAKFVNWHNNIFDVEIYTIGYMSLHHAFMGRMFKYG